MVRGPEVGGDTKIIKKSMVKGIDTKTQSPNVQQMMKKVPVEFFGVKSGVAGDSASQSGVVTRIISEVNGKGH